MKKAKPRALKASIYVFYGRVEGLSKTRPFRANGKQLKPNAFLDAEAGRFCLWVETLATGDQFDRFFVEVCALLKKTFGKRKAILDGWTELKPSFQCISGFFKKVKRL